MLTTIAIKKKVQILVIITMAAAVPTALAETPAGEKPKMEGKVAAKPGTLTAMIEDSVTFSTLAKALKAAELDVTLGAKGEFTIFAPTDDAFGKLPPEVLTKLLLPENKEKLRSLLLYHVVAGKVLAADLKDGDVKTMNGEKVKIDVESDKIEVDGSKVFSSDVMATNGVMHTIGEVLVPETLKEFIAALAK
jgi:uncharacterized surface protein with fasciclin (FAS1) repeats